MKYVAMIDLKERPVCCEFMGCCGNVPPYGLGGTAEILSAKECFIGKWIPVGERLPEEVGNYLTSIRHYGEEHFVQVSFFDGTSFKAEVEAWMPLPESYKED